MATGDQDGVTIKGSGVVVDLSGFTITGPGVCGGLLSGVFVRDGANARIHDNVITAQRAEPLNGCQMGVGIRVGRGPAPHMTSGTATIADNVISDYQKGGIVVDGPGSAATITDNDVTGVGATDLVAQNGIQVSRQATATVSGNTVSANVYTGTQGAKSVGILLFDALGDVTVSNNTISASDWGVAFSSVVPSGEVTVRANTITGGERGIILTGPTVNTRVESNRTSGAASVGIDVRATASGNTFVGNEASGSDNLNCSDASDGNRSNGTANTWTDNIGATAEPDGICSPRAAPSAPPVEIDTPVVIVLPPKSPEQPAQPPEQPAQPAGPVAEAAADEIITKMQDDQIKSCLIELRSRGSKKVVVARGVARAPAGGRGQMVIRVGIQPKGQQLLSKRAGGVIVDVRAVCRTASNEVRAGVKPVRAVLAIERAVTPPGSWVPDKPVLTSIGKRFVDNLRKRMVAIVGIRCDGHTATWPPSPAKPRTLSSARARLVCAQLRRAGRFTAWRIAIVPHGRSDPLATNATESGRAVNRRVAVTIIHQVPKRSRSARG